ncbi:MAG: PilC/PilY family type IV pilus protein [Colwellia sp.]|nr:PilC/PilY family type IV pilus protein [Colwellia sp.]
MKKLFVKKLFTKKLWKSLLALSLVSISGVTLSEDIELYVSDAVKQAGKKIKVLIIFDNSGSMNGLHTVSEDYKPATDYAAEDSAHAYNDSATYFNIGGADSSSTIPENHNDARRFLAEINSCESSKLALATHGFYTGHIREYGYSGNTGSWKELPENNGLNIEVLDCEEDITNPDDTNILPLPLGYPIDGSGSKQNPVYHTPNLPDAKKDWTGNYVTLYTANYLRWYHGQSVGEVSESKLETAQKSISTVINTTPFVEFGLEIFNYDKGDSSTDGNGGRIVFGVKEMNDTNKTNILDLINNQVTGDTWTPLCESVYEASQYYGGNSVDFGDDDIDVGSGQDKYHKNTPPQDPTIESGSKYITPFDDCASSVSHIILITDGEPTNDHAADSTILAMKSMVQTLDADNEPVFDVDGDPVLEEVAFNDASLNFDNTQYTPDSSNSYLPALAGWMSGFDVNQNLDGVQTVYTHTIGFGDGAVAATGLLEETAKRGKGKYFFADDNLSLIRALTNILTPLPSANENLTSASVSANNFDQTQTLDSVYYAMFDPENGPRWKGNLKKYKVVNGVQKGSNSKDAIDDTGYFSKDVQSYWSSSVDGNEVTQGGVAEWYTNNDVANRTLLMEGGAGGVLQDFNRTNLQAAFTDQTGLATELGVLGLLDENDNPIEDAAINELIDWAKGMDIDNEDEDGSSTDMRSDVFADPLHSKPLVVNYGNSIRIVIGTNAGALHMFQDSGSTVTESWAFMPKEFTDNIKALRDNYSTADKVYGIDGEITAHFNDINGDGIVNGADTMWIFFGLRRGGTSYYALDITTPGTPKLMWHIDENSSDFSGLGQSWSKPKIAYSKLNISGNVASPVLFFGGGYDTSKDASGPGGNDNAGKGIYMVDAKTGVLKWSMETSGGTLTYPGTDSIPSSIGILDSTGNGLTDRLYVGDTGGNVWRVDMPSDDTDDFSVFQLASLGGDTNATDRRFFYEPTIVRTLISETIETSVTDVDGNTKTIRVHQDIPYDAVLMGSGDRSNPLGTDTKDSLFMIKDTHIHTQTFLASTTPATPTVISKTDLYNYTNNPFKNLVDLTNPTPQQVSDLEDLQVAVSNKSGWYIDLEQSGEKNLAAGLVINGVAYFTSFTPPAFGAPLVACQPPRGAGSLYAVDLALGVKRHNKVENERDSDERVIEIGDEPLGTPTLIVLPKNDSDTGPADAEGDIIVGRIIIDVDFKLNTNRTYLYTTENQ